MLKEEKGRKVTREKKMKEDDERIEEETQIRKEGRREGRRQGET